MAPIELTRIETIAKRSECEYLVIEFVRGVLLPQNRGLEAIKILNRVYEGIQSDVRAREPRSAFELLLWALTGLELGELASYEPRQEEGIFLARIEKLLEQICADRAPGLSVSAGGLLVFDESKLTYDSLDEFELQCIWINALFLLGKQRPKWIVLQQLASSSLLQNFFSDTNKNIPANRILAMGRFPCVLLPYNLATQILDEFATSSVEDSRSFDRLFLPAFAEAQNRICGEADGKVIESINELENQLESKVDSISTIADARLAIELERWRKKIDASFEIAQLKRKRQLSISDDNAVRSAIEVVEHAIEATIGQHVNQLSVAIDGRQVVVSAAVPSYYIRQLVEQNSRSIVVKHLRKQFVSNIVVVRPEGK